MRFRQPCLLLSAVLSSFLVMQTGCAWTPTERQRLAAAKYNLPVEISLDLGEGVALEAVLIPPGEFVMGDRNPSPDDEHNLRQLWSRRQQPIPPGGQREVPPDFSNVCPPRHVRITKPFYMGKYEVTAGQFLRFLEASGYQGYSKMLPIGVRVPYRSLQQRFARFRTGDNPKPAANITWAEADRFCKWASTQTGRKIRLPTEAQWEYACRADTSGDYYFGAYFLHRLYENASSSVYGKWSYVGWAEKVGSRLPNPWGLHDMLGNVTEFCADDFGYWTRRPAVDPTGPDHAPRWYGGWDRVLRGGCAASGVGSCYGRGGIPEWQPSHLGGFRVVIEAKQSCP